METKGFAFQGVVTKETFPKMRAMTIQGLCIFLDIARSTWDEYRKREGFSDIITRAESIIYEQKFTGAAAEMLNANIIARDLGLTDRQDMAVTHRYADMSDDEIEAEIARLTNNLKGSDNGDA